MREKKLTPGRLLGILAVSSLMVVMVVRGVGAVTDSPAAKTVAKTAANTIVETAAPPAKEAEPFPLVESLYILILAGFRRL